VGRHRARRTDWTRFDLRPQVFLLRRLHTNPGSIESRVGFVANTTNLAPGSQVRDQGSEVQILSPRPYLVDSVDSILAVSASS
jgi:hypothetical protein